MKNFESFNPETVKKIIHEKSKKPLLEGTASEIEERGISALRERTDRYFEAMNIKPEYISSDGKTLEDLHMRLNTEGGIAISNHPGYVDIPVIINCLNREDLMIMIGEKYYPEMQNLIGDKYIIPASTDGKKLFSIMRRILDHIEKGGLFLFFPSGGGDRGKIDFKAGLPFLIKNMSANKMVFSFYIDEADVSEFVGSSPNRHIGMASSMIFPQIPNINRGLETRKVKVFESCSSAEEWLKAIDISEKDPENSLTSHYKNNFGLNV